MPMPQYENKVSCVIIRAISDKADNSAVMDYPEFERQVIRTFCKACTRSDEKISLKNLKNKVSETTFYVEKCKIESFAEILLFTL